MDGRTHGRTTRKRIASAGAYRRRRLKNNARHQTVAITYYVHSCRRRLFGLGPTPNIFLLNTQSFSEVSQKCHNGILHLTWTKYTYWPHSLWSQILSCRNFISKVFLAPRYHTFGHGLVWSDLVNITADKQGKDIQGKKKRHWDSVESLFTWILLHNYQRKLLSCRRGGPIVIEIYALKSDGLIKNQTLGNSKSNAFHNRKNAWT